MTSNRPNILLIVTDEERYNIPRPDGFSLGARDRLAVRGVSNLDAGFWRHFGDLDVAEKIGSDELRPDWTKRGFLRGHTDERYSFGRYFSPLEPNRPKDVHQLLDRNDVVLYDRKADPAEMTNLAADPAHEAADPAHETVVGEYSTKLEMLISSEIGDDTRAWVTERPQLLGWPTWKGDALAHRSTGG